MKRYIACSLVLVLGAACSPGEHQPAGSLTAPSLATAAVGVPENFRAHLSGDAVVPALPIPTRAQGQAVFQLSPDGTELSVRVLVANIENVVGAHIHLAAAGLRGR